MMSMRQKLRSFQVDFTNTAKLRTDPVLKNLSEADFLAWVESAKKAHEERNKKLENAISHYDIFLAKVSLIFGLEGLKFIFDDAQVDLTGEDMVRIVRAVDYLEEFKQVKNFSKMITISPEVSSTKSANNRKRGVRKVFNELKKERIMDY